MKPIWLVPLLALPIASWPAPKADQTVLVKSEDPEMNAAIAKAQASLDDFLKIVAHPPAGASGFKLKVRVRDSHGSEHMWVAPFKQTDGGFAGVLADEPEFVTNVRNGQAFTFARADISDWGYVLNGKQKGSFTVCVAFTRMPAKEVEQYREDYGFEC